MPSKRIEKKEESINSILIPKESNKIVYYHI